MAKAGRNIERSSTCRGVSGHAHSGSGVGKLGTVEEVKRLGAEDYSVSLGDMETLLDCRVVLP